jgi:AraC family transcriptional regulator
MFTTEILEAQPTLCKRADNVTFPELPLKIGELLQAVASVAGDAMAGPPYVRYHRIENDVFDIQAGCPVTPGTPGSGAVEAVALPGGRVAVGVHVGPYERLHESYAAMQEWMMEMGHRPSGAPWEYYLNDPGSTPQEQLRTQIIWPIAS